MNDEKKSQTGKVKIKVVEASRVEVVMLMACILFMFLLSIFFLLVTPGFDYSNPALEDIDTSEAIDHRSLTVLPENGDFPIGINTATKEDLQKIPNIGPVMAQRIIDYRNQWGTIVKISDLLSVDGIGKKTVAILEEYCVVN